MMSSCCCSPSFLPLPSVRAYRNPVPLRRSSPPPCFFSAAGAISDPLVLEIAEKLEDSFAPSPPPPPALQRLRDLSSQSLLSKPWPTNRDEAFRFTDLSFLKRSSVTPSTIPSSIPSVTPSINSLTILNGHVVGSSSVSSLPAGVFIGSLSAIPPGPTLDRVAEILAGFGSLSDYADLFWDLNGVGAPDIAVIYVPKGERIVDSPVHMWFREAEGTEVGSEVLPVSNPRVLIVVEAGAEVAIVEEHTGVEGNEERCYWANSVMEILIGEGGKVLHSYLQQQSRNAAHTKWTFTRQEESSSYDLVEISTGGRLSRHNLHIQQLGPDTVTELAALHLCQNNQIQDLHSRLILDHPRGYSRQLHKCIVSHSSGQAIFDGNIRVNRYAQQTDAGQLTRSLLLEPRATANVKPNLQIIADDVKCSHGAAISDLEEDQLFYFQARGVDLQTARDALLFSFGSEVLARLPFEPLRKSVTRQVKEVLAAR